MPLTKELQELRVVPLGNFHDETSDKVLPNFLQGFKVVEEDISFFDEISTLTQNNIVGEEAIENVFIKILGKKNGTIHLAKVIDGSKLKVESKTKIKQFLEKENSEPTQKSTRDLVKNIIKLAKSNNEWEVLITSKAIVPLIQKELWNLTMGSNMIIPNTKNKTYTIFFNSYTNILLKYNNGNYILHSIYTTTDVQKGTAQQVTDDTKWVTKNGLEVGLTQLKGYRLNQVFSSGFGGCSFQTSFFGGKAGAPDYVLFSHLQRNSPLIDILGKLKLKESDIHACLNFSNSNTGSIKDGLYGMTSGQKKTLTLLRDTYFWNDEFTSTGFSLSYSGYQIDGTKLKAISSIGYESLFGLSSYLNIKDLPVFSEFSTKDKAKIIKEKQKQLNHKSSSNGLFDYLKNKETQKFEHSKNSEVTNLYYELFKQGKLGDNFFIGTKNHLKLDDTSKKEMFIKYLCKGPHISTGNEARPNLSKTISWERGFEVKDLVLTIAKFKPNKKTEDYFIDLFAPKSLDFLTTDLNSEIKKFKSLLIVHQNNGKISLSKMTEEMVNKLEETQEFISKINEELDNNSKK